MNNENMKLRFFALDPRSHGGLPGCIVRACVDIRLPAQRPSEVAPQSADRARPAGVKKSSGNATAAKADATLGNGSAAKEVADGNEAAFAGLPIILSREIEGNREGNRGGK